MAFISNGTTVGSGGTVQGSAANLSSIPAPTNSQILSGVASVGAGDIGCYGTLVFPGSSNLPANQGDTRAGSNLAWSTGYGHTANSYVSGTWRCMGRAFWNGQAWQRCCTWLRIS